LEAKRARSLCAENVSSFYENLSFLYAKYEFPPSRIWNCNESGVQAGHNGGAFVLAKTGSRNVHQVIPDEREWLTVLTCINAAGESIPNFYIFCGKRFRRNYIHMCEQEATMAMSKKAWMTACLFSAWIDHFIVALKNHSSISLDCPHLIMDGHSSHVTINIVEKARVVGLYLLTLPLHCSHAMQSLDVAVFKPFKGAFRVYRDAWTLQNRGRGARKEILAAWTYKALQRALTVENIQAGFRRTGIYPLNHSTMDSSMGPATNFGEVGQDEHTCQMPSQESTGKFPGITIEEVLLEDPEVPYNNTHYLVNVEDSEGEGDLQFPCSQDIAGNQEQLASPGGVGIIPGVLTLPTVPVPSSRPPTSEPLVDYSKSILLTSDAYLTQMEHLAAKRSDAAKSRDARKLATEEWKRKREEERDLLVQKKKERDDAKAEKAREKAYWAQVASSGWRNDLQAHMKSSLPAPPGAYTGVYVGNVPSWCIANQRRRRMMLDMRRGTSGHRRARDSAGLSSV
jgi:hypothetical protein